MTSLHLAVLLQIVACLLPATSAKDVAEDVASLNRYTFAGNVFANREGEGPDAWVVLFCAHWFEPCQVFADTFVSAAADHGGISHDNLFSRTTRFAWVNCAVDKVLCNSQEVDVYPTVVHYRRDGRVGEWSFSGKTMEKEIVSFSKWLKKQLEHLDLSPKNEASLNETDAPADPTVPHFGVGLPVGEMMSMSVLLFAGAVWLFRLGAELEHGVRLVRELPGEWRARFKREEARVQAPLVVAVQQSPAAARSWPESWARTRIEL